MPFDPHCAILRQRNISETAKFFCAEPVCVDQSDHRPAVSHFILQVLLKIQKPAALRQNFDALCMGVSNGRKHRLIGRQLLCVELRVSAAQ